MLPPTGHRGIISPPRRAATFPPGSEMGPVARHLKSLNRRVFRRVSREDLRGALERLGLRRGDLVFANVSMRSLGYVTGGAGEMVGAIVDVIGPEGTLVTSCWPCADPSLTDPREPFDVSSTPSRAGLLSEALRQYPGSCRSLHPIASAVALGPRAEELTRKHEVAGTPFGTGSPYGRLARSEPRILLVGSHLGGLLYHVQDRVGYPNLYSRTPVVFHAKDSGGVDIDVSTPMLRSDILPAVILPGNRPESRDYLLIVDYALMFPPGRERVVMEAGYLRHNQSRFLGRRDRLAARGILLQGKVGAAHAALLDGKRMLDRVAEDLAWDIARCKEEYDPESLSRISLPRI